MPATRRTSINLALTPLDENIREAPATPGKKVKVVPATLGKQGDRKESCRNHEAPKACR